LDFNYDPIPQREASVFCRECIDEIHLIENLVKRDDRVLRLSTNAVVPGPAFKGTPIFNSEDDENEEEGANIKSRIGLPDRISDRVRNMFLINLDLQANLDKWLKGVHEQETVNG